MANYFNIAYESTAASSPGNVELNYGNSTSDGLTVQASLYAGSDFTPTHYKMWGVELVTGEGVVTISGAEWLPFVETRTVRLARHNDPQSAYVKFKNVAETETETFQSNSVTFNFVEPIIHGSTLWKQDFEGLGFNSASSNVLKNDSFKTEVELNKSKLSQLSFSGRNFSGLRVEPDTIYINPDSEIGQIIGLDTLNYVTINKVFETSDIPMITVDYGNGFDTLTTYDQDIRTTLSGSNVGRVSNVVWNAGTKTLSFDAYKFSTYGFCIVQKVEFTNDSQTGVYTGNDNVMRVYVQDSNGEPVENAPVTLSGSGDTIGTIAETMPVLTGDDGIAEFTLSVTSVGATVFEASVDGVYFSDPNLTVVGIEFGDHQRSLLTQYEQIRRSAEYDDAISDVNTEAVAEPSTPTASGSSTSVLEHDLNVIRTLMKQLKGTDNWYDALPSYQNPEDTAHDITVSLSGIAGHTLDAKTIILAVNDSNSGNGFSITPGDGGFLFTNTLAYATHTDLRGLPIFSSTTNSGTYYDVGESEAGVVTIDLLDITTNSEFRDSNGDLIYAKFHDAADHSGTGTGVDVYVKFYTDAGPYTFTANDPTIIRLVYPYRKIMSAVEEHEWSRTDFVSSWEGDDALVDNIVDLWAFVGSADNTSSPAWTSISGSPMVSSEDSIFDAIEAINTSFGDRIYTEHNYIDSGDLFTDSLDDLDMAIAALAETMDDGTNEKHVEIVTEDIPAGTVHQLPIGVSYTPSSDSGQQGKNMDVYLDGQLLAASTGVLGANEDKDYSETSTTHITFHFDIYQYSNITYQVRQ